MKTSGRQLVNNLITNGVLKTPELIAAFEAIDRADFVPPAAGAGLAYIDEPLPIGFGQTISQPWTVAFMLEQLQPKIGQNILDIGSGSGWQTALLSHVVGPPTGGGRVIGLELIPDLNRQSLKNISKYNFVSRRVAEMHCLNGAKGFPSAAPFDRIISAAAAEAVPPAWLEQLKIGGRLVAPIDSTIVVMTKPAPDRFITATFPGFAFVPFVEK